MSPAPGAQSNQQVLQSVGWPQAGENSVSAALKALLRVMGISGWLQKICEGEENEGTLSGIDCLHHQNVPGIPKLKNQKNHKNAC